MAKKRYYDERRSMEYNDSMMIKEDRSAVANLPQQVVMKEYPKSPYLVDGDMDLNDNIRGVDMQMWKDSHGKDLKKKSYPEKY